MILHLFNPENDLALADGNANYSPPPAAVRIAYDLASLPLWYASADDYVFIPDDRHLKYHSEMSELFPLPKACTSVGLLPFAECRPWGWSSQMLRRFKAMGVNENILPGDSVIGNVRRLSNRRSSIAILGELSKMGVDIPELPIYATSPDDVAAFVSSMPRSVVKAPWSGSGKGIAWGLGRVEVPLEHFYKGVIRRQGGVVCEHFLNSAREFAMEFFASADEVSFVGYSLFEAQKGSYSGNLLLCDEEIERILSAYLPAGTVENVRTQMQRVLTRLIAGSGYRGYLGVDMMIYDSGGVCRLNPCVELNLRMNMGVVSRIFHNKFAGPGKTGRFNVAYFRNRGEAHELHCVNRVKYPLMVRDGKIEKGYLNLSPVDADSSYIAFAVVE